MKTITLKLSEVEVERMLDALYGRRNEIAEIVGRCNRLNMPQVRSAIRQDEDAVVNLIAKLEKG